MTNINLFRLPCPTYMITHLCLCTENYIVVPLNEDGNIAFWNTTNISELPVILRGHNQLVTAIALSHHPKAYYLCSCSSDHIILWNLLQNNGNPTKGRILHSNMEQPVYCNFCPNNLEIGVSFSYGIWIYSLKENAWIASIEGVCFTIFKFCTNSLIGITDNFVKVWKINTNELENKITIAPGAPSVLPSIIHSNILTIGTTCGHINIYENYCKLIRSILVWKIVVKHQKSKDSNEGTYDDIRSNSFPVLAIHVFKFENQYELPNMLPETIYILVITNTCLFIININNETVLFYLDFNNINSSLNNVETSEIGLVRSAALAQDFNNTTIYISLIPVIDESIIFFKLYLENILNLENKSYQNEENSIFHTPLFKTENDADKSLLIYRMQNSCKIKNLKKSPKPLNHPVTFHSKIKSSGYGTLQKHVTLFHPQLSKSRKCQSLNSLTSKKQIACGSQRTFYEQDKVINLNNLKLLDKIVVSENSTISQLQTTADGMYASYASSDGHTDIFRILKKNIKICHTLNCHLGDVNAAKWSHTGKMLITCGNDKTAKIWNFEKSKQNPILTIGVNDNSKALKQKKFHFEESVNQAQFFYLDHFLLISSGNKLYLFDYIINIEKSGIKSCINRSSVKLVKEIPLESKRISAITAANQFFSSIVLCAGTSKSINVVDMTVGKVAWQTDDCGAKSPHIIAINEGSPYTTQSLEMYNLFMTSSLIDGIKIWDLRTKKSVLCYNEHKCRLFPCSATFSPCGKFIISGSEDKSAYNYELRKLSYVDKITDQNADVFIGTAFTPNSQLLLSSMNGSVYFYGKDK